MRFFKCFKLVLFRPVAGLDLFVMVCLFPEPLVRHVTRYSQRISSTPRLSRQSRSVSMICRGTVQTSSHIMTRGMNFWPIRSGAKSFRPLHRKKLWYVCAFTPSPASLWRAGVSVSTRGLSLPEELYRYRGFSAASAAVQLAQLVPCQLSIVSQRG